MTNESELSQKLKTMSRFDLICNHIGLVEVKLNDNKYLQDKWSVTLSYKGQSYTTEYNAGIGHRKLNLSIQKDRNGFYNKMSGDFKNERAACEVGWLKLVSPTLCDVVGCLLSDSSGAEGTFEDFCSEFGYNPDSRKALEIYLACQTTRNTLIKMFGLELFEELSQLEH